MGKHKPKVYLKKVDERLKVGSDEFKEQFSNLKLAAKKEIYIKVLTQYLGNIAAACDAVGIVRQTHYNWAKNDKFKAQVDDISERSIDFVEGKLMSNIKDGDTTAAIFYLKTKGKKRGYIETRHDINATVNMSKDEFEDMTDKELDEYIKNNGG